MADALEEICSRSGLITNGIILELGDRVDSSFLAEHFGTSKRALSSKVKRLKDNRRKLQRAASYDEKHKAVLDNFLKEKFCPKSQLHVPVDSDPKPTCHNCSSIRKLYEEECDTLKKKVDSIKQKQSALHDRTLQKLKTARQKIRTLHKLTGPAADGKEIALQLQRVTHSRSQWKRKWQLCNRKYKALRMKHDKAELRAKKYRQKYCRLVKSMKKTQTCNPKKRVTIETKDYHELMDKIDELEDEVAKAGKGAIPTMAGKKFNSKIREVSYYLQVCKICKVIENQPCLYRVYKKKTTHSCNKPSQMNVL